MSDNECNLKLFASATMGNGDVTPIGLVQLVSTQKVAEQVKPLLLSPAV